jgi:hypothetical protein
MRTAATMFARGREAVGTRGNSRRGGEGLRDVGCKEGQRGKMRKRCGRRVEGAGRVGEWEGGQRTGKRWTSGQETAWEGTGELGNEGGGRWGGGRGMGRS